MLKAVYGKTVMKKSAVFDWHKWFKEERKGVKNDGRSGCSKLIECEKIRVCK